MLVEVEAVDLADVLVVVEQVEAEMDLLVDQLQEFQVLLIQEAVVVAAELVVDIALVEQVDQES